MYYNGEGVPRNYAEAMKWYLKAAEQNDEPLRRDALFKLSNMCCRGEGVPKDYVRGYMWLLILRGRNINFGAEDTKWFNELVGKIDSGSDSRGAQGGG